MVNIQKYIIFTLSIFYYVLPLIESYLDILSLVFYSFKFFMKAFRRYAKEPRAARIEEVKIPEPGGNEVRLRVSHCGICGSDLHAWLDHPGYEFVLEQVTFGHELSGTVERTGSEATKWAAGDKIVMIALQTPHDEDDRYCREGLPQLSARRRVQGLHLDGGMADPIMHL